MVFGLIAGTLLILFFSEAILREASVVSLKKKNKDLDSVLSSVPAFLRGRIKAKIELMELKDAVAKAKTELEKVVAITNLAAYLKDENQKESLYSDILKLKRYPESYSAMLFFLERDNSNKKISIEEYHNFIKQSPKFNQFSLWSVGFQELKNKNKDRNLLLKYLSPLLSYTPDFYDYRQLYKNIYELAIRVDDKEIAKRADELSVICEELPSIYEVMEKIERERNIANEKNTGNR